MMSSSNSFTNLETTNLRLFLVKVSLFIYSYVCTMNVINNIQICRFVVSKYSWNHVSIQSLNFQNWINNVSNHLEKKTPPSQHTVELPTAAYHQLTLVHRLYLCCTSSNTWVLEATLVGSDNGANNTLINHWTI